MQRRKGRALAAELGLGLLCVLCAAQGLVAGALTERLASAEPPTSTQELARPVESVPAVELRLTGEAPARLLPVGG